MVQMNLLGRATTLLATTSPLARRAGAASMFGSLFGLREPVMVKPEDALPGRQQKMPISDEHYVLRGNSMEGPWPEGYKVAIFANGCFWGSEKGIWRLPGDGIYSTAVGYAAGFTPNPTYEECCSGRSGQTEAVQVVYDPRKISFVDIARWMFEAHDPTTLYSQGNDVRELCRIPAALSCPLLPCLLAHPEGRSSHSSTQVGTQYRSGFYWLDDEQKELILASKAAYEKALGRPVVTECAAASDYDQYGGCFFYAEDYHQQYLAKPGARPYCSAQPQGVSMPPFEEWCPPGLEHHAPKLPEAFWRAHAPGAGCKVVQAPNQPIKMGEW